MVTAQVILELRTARDSFEWIFCGQERKIRGFLKTGEIAIPFDPVTALCLIKTGCIFEDECWAEAGAAMGFSHHDCRDIVDACNNRFTGRDMAPDPYKAWLRRQIIFALGLYSVSTSCLTGTDSLVSPPSAGA